MTKRIRTEAFLPHPPERVWAVLADFGAYAEWNPLNVRAEGEAWLGARISMAFRNLTSGRGTIEQIVTIVACEPGRSLAWAGRVPLLFRGRHFFELAPVDGGTRLLHGEDLGGLFPRFWSKARLGRDFVPHYEAVNAALAARLDSLADAP